MGKITKSNKVHPFIAILYQTQEHYSEGLKECEQKFGPILGESAEYNFSDITSYYDSEMGKNLKKRLLVFESPRSLENLHNAKIWSNNIEQELSGNTSRNINMDPGYLGLSKLVLFSTKNYSHRIYIKDGIYAEVTLIFEQKEFKVQSWTYPDYSRSETLTFLHKMRSKIKQKARNKGYMQGLD